MYGELKCFIKPFTRLETSSNSLNSHQKILQKNPDFRLVEFSFRLVEQELSSDRDIQKLQDFFFTISIDRAKASTNQKCLTSNFHLKNFRTWIFTSWNNILQTQTSLLQPIHVYTYIYNKNLQGFYSLFVLINFGVMLF